MIFGDIGALVEWVTAWWSILLSYGAAGLAIAGLVAAAIFLPFVPRFRLVCIIAAAVTLGHTVAFTVGIKQGADRVRAEWNQGLAREAKQGEAQRKDAERTVAAEPPASVRDDVWNRDGWTDGKRP